MKDEQVPGRLRARADPTTRLFLLLAVAITVALATSLGTVQRTSAQVDTCGNGTVDPDEDCDPSSPSGALCLPGELCVDCLCTTCGNGVVDPGEPCDPSSPSGALLCQPGEVCTPDCECLPVATTTSSTTVVVTTLTTTTAPTTTTTEPNHFQCYEIKRSPAVNISGVSIQDQFGTSTATLVRAKRLCAPTNKEGEDPTAPSDPDHLKGYDNPHSRAKVVNQVITNQFGSITLDVTKPKFLLVPSAKGLVGNPPPLVGPTSDHFQCYRVKRSRGTPRFQKIFGVSAQDQFGPYTVDLVRPRWLCAPANKNNEDPTAPTHPSHLLCYKTKTQRFTERTVFTTDQFGSAPAQLLKRWELCVPSLKNVATTTTTSTAPPTTTSVAPTTTTSSTAAETTTTSSTTTTLYGSPSRAFLQPVLSLLE
jgi:hypothetical protein